MYNSIREQIDRINGDWNKLDNEKSLEIERMKEQDAIKSHKMTELSIEVEKLRQ